MQSDAPCRSEPRLRLGRSIPAMEHRTRVGNRLLAALPPADLDLLVPHFRMVALERDAVLVRSGDPIERIYFPLSGLIAFIMDMPNGQTVATAVVGNEGAAGVLTTLGPTRSPMTAVVRVAGTALANFAGTISGGARPQQRLEGKRFKPSPGRCWPNSSTSQPAMRCTRSRPAWRVGCCRSTIGSTATSCR